jgi:hypothetical protein
VSDSTAMLLADQPFLRGLSADDVEGSRAGKFWLL